MNPLNRKLLRDLWRMRGQVLAIALVVASGVALLVMALSTQQSLRDTATAYYERYRFADVFATAKRAPDRLVDRIAAIPGVRTVEARIVRLAVLDIDGVNEPVIGQIVSLPERHEPKLNALALRAGRAVAPDRPDEVVVNEPFAEAHRLAPGTRLHAVLNGRKRELTVVGVALSPEFVYAIGPGALMPDDRRYGILWMGRKALAAAYDFEGAFNSVSLALLPGVDGQSVIDRLDALLDPYGGAGAIARADQISNWFLMNELEQQRTIALILPTIFLAVAAFLTQMVMARLIATERSEIGLMKAFGYSGGEIAWHYACMALTMAVIGILAGSAIGAALGQYNTCIYADLFSFPFLLFRPGPSVFAIGAAVSLAAALVGALGAVRGAARLPPAEAMRPPAPPAYHHGGSQRLLALLDQPTRIILRQIFPWPVRSLLTSAGVAMSVAVLITALQWKDSIDRLLESEFYDAQRQDLMLDFVEDQSAAVLHEAARLPGVQRVEPVRFASVRLRVGARSHRGAITGLPADGRLMVIYDAGLDTTLAPSGGLILSTRLADKLAAGVGDIVEVSALEGRRARFSLPVTGLVETYIGTPAWMEIGRLQRLLRTGDGVATVNLRVDPRADTALFARLKQTPDVAAVLVKRSAIDTFNETMGDTVLTFIAFFVGFAAALGFGVTYNSARMALSERGRDLATLRVLGFTRGEVAYILLGEIALLVCGGLAFGCVAGWGLSLLIAAAFDTERFRIPLVVAPATYGYGVVGALVTGLVSALLVRRLLDRIDLIAVLKTRE